MNQIEIERQKRIEEIRKEEMKHYISLADKKRLQKQ